MVVLLCDIVQLLCETDAAAAVRAADASSVIVRLAFSDRAPITSELWPALDGGQLVMEADESGAITALRLPRVRLAAARDCAAVEVGLTHVSFFELVHMHRDELCRIGPTEGPLAVEFGWPIARGQIVATPRFRLVGSQDFLLDIDRHGIACGLEF